MAGYKANLEAIREHLLPGEEIAASCFGRYSSTAREGTRTGLLVVTPKRVIFFTLTRFGYEHEMEAFDVSRVASVETAQGLLGPYIDLRTPEAAITLKWIQAGSPEAFARFARAVTTPGQPVEPAAAATSTKDQPKTEPTQGCLALVLLGALGWWLSSGNADAPATPPPAPAPVPTEVTWERAPLLHQTPQPTPPQTAERVSTRALRASLRSLVADGRRLPRGDDWDCGEQMRALIQQADDLQAQADTLPLTEGGHVTGPDGRPIGEHLALGTAAGHARLCVTCSPDAIQQCEMASGYLRR